MTLIRNVPTHSPPPSASPESGVRHVSGGGGQGDGDVVAAVLGGDRNAYRLLVQRHQDRLFRYALRMSGSGDAAADLTQAALVQGYTRLADCRNPERFGAWIFRILVNRCRDHLKSPRRRSVSLDDARAAHTPSPDDPARTAERSELKALLDAALAQLPDTQREAFVLKHVEGMAYEEMSELLDAAVPALKMRVHRAREALRGLLEETL